MSKYTITIQEINPPKEGRDYDDTNTIYRQTVDQLDIGAVVDVVNKIYQNNVIPLVTVKSKGGGKTYGAGL